MEGVKDVVGNFVICCASDLIALSNILGSIVCSAFSRLYCMLGNSSCGRAGIALKREESCNPIVMVGE